MKKAEVDAGKNGEASAFPWHYPGEVSQLQLSQERTTCFCLKQISDYNTNCAQRSPVSRACRRQSTQLCVPAQPDTGGTHRDVRDSPASEGLAFTPGFAPPGCASECNQFQDILIKIFKSKTFWSLKAHLNICLDSECTQLLIQTHLMVHGC